MEAKTKRFNPFPALKPRRFYEILRIIRYVNAQAKGRIDMDMVPMVIMSICSPTAMGPEDKQYAGYRLQLREFGESDTEDPYVMSMVLVRHSFRICILLYNSTIHPLL